METTQKLERSIIILADRISYEIGATDALKYTQAALNLTHAIMVLMSKPKE